MTSLSQYEARMRRVLEYIYDNVDGDLSLDALCDVAAMSRFHWHRVFHGMTGETCAQAVRRMRLHRAACWLVQTDRSIADIAQATGLGSQQAFTRLFKDAYGTTPSTFRNRGELRPMMLRKSPEDFVMYTVELDTMPAQRLGAIAHKGPYLEVGAAFEQVQAIMTARKLWSHATGMAGVYYDDPNAVAAKDLRSHAGVIVDDAMDMPDVLEEVPLTAGRIARLRYTGPYAGLRAAYDYLYGEWLPKSSEEPRDAPVIEVYLNSPHDTAPGDLVTDICLPLQ